VNGWVVVEFGIVQAPTTKHSAVPALAVAIHHALSKGRLLHLRTSGVMGTLYDVVVNGPVLGESTTKTLAPSVARFHWPCGWTNLLMRTSLSGKSNVILSSGSPHAFAVGWIPNQRCSPRMAVDVPDRLKIGCGCNAPHGSSHFLPQRGVPGGVG